MTQVNVKFPKGRKSIKMRELKPGQFAIMTECKALVLRTASTLNGVSEVMEFPPRENGCWTWHDDQLGPGIDVIPVEEVTIIVEDNYDE